MQKVSRVLNERTANEEGDAALSRKLSDPTDFDLEDPELLLRPDDNILLRRDSRCIIMDAFELGREFPEVEIDPRLVFDNPTIEQLSQAIVDLPKTQRTKSVESASTAQPGVTLTSVPFTQLTTFTGEVAPCAYHPAGDASRYMRSRDGMESVLIPGGQARIGDDTSCPSARENEGPSHMVELSTFLMDIEPVSLGAYARFLNSAKPNQDQLFDWCLLPAEDARCAHLPLTLGEDGWQVKMGVPPNWPMILVSWYGANAYALWAHGQDWRNYRSAASAHFLPTEAQWEYAARGQETLQFPWGDEDATPDLLNVCWDASTYDSKGNVTAHVATPLEELPLVGVNVLMGVSPFGLRGMAGNVWQWCRDTYHTNFYMCTEASLKDAWNAEEEEGALKSERGGSWVGPAVVPVNPPRQVRMQMESFDESQVIILEGCFCNYEGCLCGPHIGCAEKDTCCCIELDCCCKTGSPCLRFGCCDLRVVDTSALCKVQAQTCCCVRACSLPPDHTVPSIFGLRKFEAVSGTCSCESCLYGACLRKFEAVSVACSCESCLYGLREGLIVGAAAARLRRLSGACSWESCLYGACLRGGLVVGAAAARLSFFSEHPIARREPLAEILASTGEGGNYGELVRLHLEEPWQGTKEVIAKQIRPTISEVGMSELRLTEHRRFLRGFQVEAAAYENLSAELLAANLTVPRLLHVERSQDATNWPLTIFLEDLSLRFPRGARGQVRRMTLEETHAALRWLAGLHALFWERPKAALRGLWPRGTYWILDKLGKLQLEALPEGFHNRYLAASEVEALQWMADALDARMAGRDPLNATQPPDWRFRTLVHGDAKPENILCTAPPAAVHCAALDFGWVGEGYGACDVAYLLWDQIATNVVEDLVNFYYSLLQERLPASSVYSRDILQQHFDLCVMDFMRWQLGFQGGRHFWAMFLGCHGSELAFAVGLCASQEFMPRNLL
ncbi:unnamed protein product [Cladocopium goreaui]|uniref:Serine/threonine-protein kinase pkn1 n=1 Tax=Cladocopium goreaui TaxID=2562237 RepID=A0A9P1FG31_9DINO|nr:unnamed protein product [Cladocopium goreaui]